MTNIIQRIVRGADAAIADLYLSIFKERNALVPFLFHSLFRNEREIDLNVVDPLQRTTIRIFRQFIEYYLEHGYRFISPADLVAGLEPDRKYAMITFDDGYYNNMLAVPILKEFGVPAVFFISADHVQQGKCFWWDVLYRERMAQGVGGRKIWREGVSFKSLRTDQIEAKLSSIFGPRAFEPRGDIDRPFSEAELKEFAASPFVHIGNHSANHAILTNYSDEEMRRQVIGAQESLAAMTGRVPIAIAYPNGAHNDLIVKTCREAGLKVGFTTRPAKRGLPLDALSPAMLTLGRFCPHGEAPILTQCKTYRSDVLLYGMFRDGYLRLIRGQVAN